jgi:CBS domain-containing protein
MRDTVKMALRKEAPSVSRNDSVETAIEMLVAGCGSALVVMSGQELVGIVTAKDLLHSLNRGDKPGVTTVLEVMSPCELITAKGTRSPCVQLDEGESVVNALRIMEEAGISHMLVSGAGGKVTGIATLVDLLGQAVA